MQYSGSNSSIATSPQTQIETTSIHPTDVSDVDDDINLQVGEHTELNATEITLVNTDFLSQLYNSVQQLQIKQDAFQATVIAEFASLHVKMDAIANRCVVSEDLFSPVNSSEGLRDLDEKAKDPTFFRNVVLRLGNPVGKGTPGGTAALLLIHKFFDKTFLLSCSWSGKARGELKTKIAFIQHTHVLNLFAETVQFCDPSFSVMQCNEFLKVRLKNAKQNCSLKNARTTACRPNRKRKLDDPDETISAVVDETFNGVSSENNRESENYGDGETDGLSDNDERKGEDSAITHALTQVNS